MGSENASQLADGEVSVLARGLRILDTLADQSTLRGASLTELAQTVGLNKATAFRLLNTLRAYGYVDKDPDTERYRLGLTILHLSAVLLQNLDLRIQAAPILADLVQRTNETVHLGVLDQGSVVYIDKVECSSSVRMHSRVGMQMPACSTALGKAILAHLPAHPLDQVLNAGLVRRTPNTITDEQSMRAHLEITRARGYAVDDCENEDGIRCVAAPVFDHAGRVIGAISTAGPAGRLTVERTLQLGPVVKEAARQISQRMGSRA
jgi:DNA-binding IclR family transcriptional regulator